MVSLLEIAHRARRGPKISEKDWNLLLFNKSQELTKDFGLEDLGPETYIDIDADYADKAFQAAIRFLVEVGILMLPVNRIIKFTEHEVKEQIRHAPSEITVGEGKDARTIYRRGIEDRRPCNVNSALHAPYSEDLIGLVVKHFAQAFRLSCEPRRRRCRCVPSVS